MEVDKEVLLKDKEQLVASCTSTQQEVQQTIETLTVDYSIRLVKGLGEIS